MKYRKNNRREGSKDFKKSGNRNSHRNNDDKRKFSKHNEDRNNEYDFDRKESRRRKALRDDNWFDIEPNETQNYNSQQKNRDDKPRKKDFHNNEKSRDSKYFEKPDKRQFKHNDDNKNNRSRRDYDNFDDNNVSFKKSGKQSFKHSSKDSHERKYNDYKHGRSRKNYDNFDEFDDDEEFVNYDNRHNNRDRSDNRRKDFRNKTKDTPKPSKKSNGETRLNKYIANAGICSRREADVLIESGAVSVNGEVVTQLGYKVKPGDTVHYGGEKLISERKRYILLNKPKGFITTMDDPQERKTVMNLIADACKERIYPVGRLDRNTTGLLLFTNDGDLAKKLTHPSTGARKVYHVELDKPLTQADRRKMLEGITLEDGDIAVDAVEYEDDNKHCIGVELHSGRNRIVRRTFEALGYEVYKLDRVIFAELTKKNLTRGRWRELTDKEISFLKML